MNNRSKLLTSIFLMLATAVGMAACAPTEDMQESSGIAEGGETADEESVEQVEQDAVVGYSCARGYYPFAECVQLGPDTFYAHYGCKVRSNSRLLKEKWMHCRRKCTDYGVRVGCE